MSQQQVSKEEIKNYPRQICNLVFGPISGLNHTHRFSGSLKIRNQSVAEHSYWTALIAGVLAHIENRLIINKSFGDSDTKPRELISLQQVYERALLHDVDEVLSGDIIHTFKHGETSQAFSEQLNLLASSLVATQLFVGLPMSDILLGSYKNSHVRDDIHFIIKMADWLQLLQYTVEERRCGNTMMDEKIERGLSLIEKLASYPVDLFIKDIMLQVTKQIRSDLKN